MYKNWWNDKEINILWSYTCFEEYGDPSPKSVAKLTLVRDKENWLDIPSLLHWSKNDVTPNDRVLIALLYSLLLKELLDATCPNKNRINRPDECSVVSLSPSRVHRPVAMKIFAPYFENLWTRHQSSIMTTACLAPMAHVNHSTSFCLTAPILNYKTKIQSLLKQGSSSLLICNNVRYLFHSWLWSFNEQWLLATNVEEIHRQ